MSKAVEKFRNGEIQYYRMARMERTGFKSPFSHNMQWVTFSDQFTSHGCCNVKIGKGRTMVTYLSCLFQTPLPKKISDSRKVYSLEYNTLMNKSTCSSAGYSEEGERNEITLCAFSNSGVHEQIVKIDGNTKTVTLKDLHIIIHFYWNIGGGVTDDWGGRLLLQENHLNVCENSVIAQIRLL